LPENGTQILADVVEPYFERTWEHFCSHNQTPPAELTPYLAACRNGQVAYISYPIFRLFALYGNQSHRLLVKNVLDLMIPEPLLLVDGPTGLETTVTRQDERTIVHLLFYSPERRTPDLDLIEDIIPLYNLRLSLKSDRAPRKVYLAPEQTPLPYEFDHGYVRVTIPQINGHGMIVVE
jgi:hypothetical protein